MAVKKSQIEDKALRPDKEVQSERIKNKEEKKNEKKQEFNYPEHGITVKATSKKEADKKLKEIIN